MVTTPGEIESAAARGRDPVKVPIAVAVITSVVLALGVLCVGLVLEGQAVRSDQGLDYVAIVAYASAAALTVALVLLGRALFSSARARLQRLFRANIVVSVVAAGTAVGNLLATQVHTWTTTITCDGCDSITVTPTANQIAASVALDLGAGALAALLPAIAVLLMRNRRESAADQI